MPIRNLSGHEATLMDGDFDMTVMVIDGQASWGFSVEMA